MPTEDVLALLELLEIPHNINISKVVETGDFISKELGRENLSGVGKDEWAKIPEMRKELF